MCTPKSNGVQRRVDARGQLHDLYAYKQLLDLDALPYLPPYFLIVVFKNKLFDWITISNMDVWYMLMTAATNDALPHLLFFLHDIIKIEVCSLTLLARTLTAAMFATTERIPSPQPDAIMRQFTVTFIQSSTPDILISFITASTSRSKKTASDRILSCRSKPHWMKARLLCTIITAAHCPRSGVFVIAKGNVTSALCRTC